MTQEEIIEGNKLIAEFDGWSSYKIEKGLSKGMTAYSNEKFKMYRFPLESMKYHSSWDWLMPVVRKVWNISEEIDIKYSNEDEYHKQFYALTFHKLYIWTDIETVWLAVIEFIKWYNSTKTKS